VNNVLGANCALQFGSVLHAAYGCERQLEGHDCLSSGLAVQANSLKKNAEILTKSVKSIL